MRIVIKCLGCRRKFEHTLRTACRGCPQCGRIYDPQDLREDVERFPGDLSVILSAAGNVQVVNGVSVRGRAWVDYHCRTGSELFGLHYTAFVAMARGLEVSSEVLEGVGPL